MKRLLSIIMAALPLAVAAQAQLTLDDCLRMARRYNHRLAAADWQQQAAQGELRSTRALFFPSLTLSGSYLYSTARGSYEQEGGNLPVITAEGQPVGTYAYFPGLSLDLKSGSLYGGGLLLEQPIYMGGRIVAGYRMAKVADEIARQNSRLTLNEVLVETSRAYANVVLAREAGRVAQRYHQLLSELMRSVESAARRGLKSKNDVLKVQVKLNESELKLRRADNALRLATMNLCHYIGRPLDEVLSTEGSLPEPDGEVSSHEGIAERPEFQMLAGKSEVARQQLKMARGERLPQLGLVGGYTYLNGLELNGTKLMHDWVFTVGVQLTLPLVDFGKQAGKVRAARARYEQTLAQQQESSEQMQLQVTQAANNYDEALLELRLAESSVAAADENLRMSSRQYEAGIEPLSDHLEAQTLWQQAQMTLVEARIGRFLQHLEFMKATGRLRF